MHSAAHRIFAIPEWLGSHVHSEANNMFAIMLRRCTVCNGAKEVRLFAMGMQRQTVQADGG